jgi:hypothetical protein
MATLEHWIRAHESWIWIMGAVSVVMFLGTLIALMIVIVKLPSRYFIEKRHEHPLRPSENGVLLALYLIFKNFIGIFLIVAGLAMLVLPGQGLLTLIIGISLTDFPRKRRLIRLLIRQKAVLQPANLLRKKFGRPPLQAQGKRS